MANCKICGASDSYADSDFGLCASCEGVWDDCLTKIASIVHPSTPLRDTFDMATYMACKRWERTRNDRAPGDCDVCGIPSEKVSEGVCMKCEGEWLALCAANHKRFSQLYPLMDIESAAKVGARTRRERGLFT